MKNKFRVFDKEINEYSDDEFLIDADGRLYAKYWSKMLGWRISNVLSQNRFVIEMCSNLGDTDDNMLFEKDILYDEINDVYGIIYLREGGFVVDFDDIIEDLYECNLSCELVGNMNENINIVPWKTRKMSKFKIGDKVRVREDLSMSKMYGMSNNNTEECISDDMIEFCGEIVTITMVHNSGNYYKISEDNETRYWTDEMFESGICGIDHDAKRNKTTKPPLGVTRKNIFMYERALELSRAIHEYLVAGKKVNQEWLDELLDLNEYIVESEE